MTSIGNFPGIDKLLQDSDAVVVATIRRRMPSADDIYINGLLLCYECYIQQTLKGVIRPKSNVVLRVGDDYDNFPRALREETVAILFLDKHAKYKEGIEYTSPRVIGATIEIATVGSETVSPSGTPKERIKALIRHYRRYRDKELRHEEELLTKALRS